MEMKESSTYQYIIQEGIEQGIEQGRTQEARRLLLIMGGKRFGEPDAQVQAALDKITSPQQLEQLAARLFEVESWQELLR
jgi:predicted transposase YdaD